MRVCACLGAGGYQVFRATHVRTHLTLSNQNWVYVQAIYFSVIFFLSIEGYVGEMAHFVRELSFSAQDSETILRTTHFPRLLFQG